MGVISLKQNWKLLLVCLAVPLVVGGVAARLTQESMMLFIRLNKPPLSPPGWLFPVVWTVLYTLMGVASYLVLTAGKPQEMIERAIRLYFLQLVVNFFWPILFFNQSRYLFAFFWLVLLWLLILGTAVQFYKIRPLAGYLMIPYLLWVTFAGYLNLSIYFLN